MKAIPLLAWVALAFAALFAGGCSTVATGPATQGDINNVTTKFKQNENKSDPDVPVELRNKGVSPGTMIKKGG
ncbi:MAG TPA: hypothetical protein VMI31_13720 [Fimbriimonadaceae bacterium]|nr:hypothetical protein [Fimbriimonadaceae bacterium]